MDAEFKLPNDQIQKKLDWLDEERRKDKTRLGVLEERINAVDGNIAKLAQQLNELRGEATRLGSYLARIETVEQSLLQARLENKQALEDSEKLSRKREEEAEKLRRAELRSLESALNDLRKELDPIPELRRGMKARAEEEIRLARLIDEVRERIESVRRNEEEFTRTVRLLDESRRQDAKRITDLQGETSAFRKRFEDQISKIELVAAGLKKAESRLAELSSVEIERREAVTNFLNTQALKDVERERIWREWQTRFQVVETQAADIEATLQNLDTSARLLKRTQQTVDELAQKVERRISEITEIQRLADERFRQEWVTFKADDQKRWTNYTLTTDEQRSESLRQHEKVAEKLTRLEESLQETQDSIGQMAELSAKRLQSLLASAHEWVTEYERSLGAGRSRPDLK